VLEELQRDPALPRQGQHHRTVVQGRREAPTPSATGIEHTDGHHFADEAKARARRITDLVEHDGILIFKLNEGAHHVSVNPRRLREVGEIINGTCARGEESERRSGATRTRSCPPP
jgi:hypothetical protein